MEVKQEQLSLEVCKQISNLFPESEKVYAYRPSKKGEATLEDRVNYIGRIDDEHIAANHPSITDMMVWLWGNGRWAGIPCENFCFVSYDENLVPVEKFFFKGPMRRIEAYAEAVKLVMKRNEVD